MQFDWIYSPITQYSVTAVGLAASLLLWIGAKAELRTLRKDMAEFREKAEGELRNLSAGLEEIRTARQTAPEPLAAPVGQALNLTKRAQVLRMHNRGESIHSIAAALQIPSGEVNLLLKIERLTDAEPMSAAR
jgi:Flp pilus assembly protein TadB